ncbi:hypothetical protein Cfor_11334 [Coptotermes formosanus]|uniref:Uncharacterized protein n=1 Tax=Coptotermes formosanus TaxID=36987 RepID=A0A6L2P849_COPFO|nr:hypothetical protein Cfor_11334 [Coptotermes formosanus]
MVVLERYLQLYERESQLISSAWKTFHIFFYVIVALSGIAAGSAFSQVLESFGGNCVLHSNVTFVSDKTNNSSTSYLTIDCVKTEWGRQSDCSFCQYVPVCSVIFSIVWITFFLMCGRGGKTTRGLSQPWRIVLPSLIFNITFLGVALAAACKLHDGINVFCSSFQDDMDETNCHDLARYQLMEGNTGLLTYKYMKVAQISSWINVAGWSMSVIVLLMRCFCAPDFQLIQISILAPTPVQEQHLSSRQDSIDGVCEDMIDHGNTGRQQSHT